MGQAPETLDHTVLIMKLDYNYIIRVMRSTRAIFNDLHSLSTHYQLIVDKQRMSRHTVFYEI